MNWRKYIDKLLYNLKLKFKSKEELLTEEVLTFNFKYSDIKDINIKYEFIDKDIITSIQKIKLLLKNNFNNGSDLEDIPKVRSVDYVNQKIIYYLSNDNKKIPDLNIVIKEFMLLSNELIKKYELMVKYRNEDVEY